MSLSVEGPWRVALAAALTVLATGCSVGTSMNRDEAEERLEEHATATANALPDELELDPFEGIRAPTCGSSEEQIRVSETYWLDGLPKEDNEASVEALVDHWQDNGYEITRDDRPQELKVFVVHDEDEFALNVKTSVQGDLSLHVSSPCFWPEGNRWGWSD